MTIQERAFFILVKGQVTRETEGILESLKTINEIDKYLKDSRSMSLNEWLESLTLEHNNA